MNEMPREHSADPKPVVLVVDDQPLNLAMLSEIVRSLGIEVRAAANGQTALRFAHAEPRPDLILLDVMMPGMDGHQVLAELRKLPETRDIPVIFVTALNTPEDEESGLLEGAADYITKPIKPAVLRARVEAQLELRRARQHLADENEWLEHEVAQRLEQNARLSARLDLALDASGLGVWEYSPAHAHEPEHLHWRQGLSSRRGDSNTPESLTAWLALIHPEDQEKFVRLMNGEADISTQEIRSRSPQGDWRWLEIRGKWSVTREGQRILTGLVEDITDRRQREAEHRLSGTVLAGISDGVVITNAVPEILQVNEAFTRLTGYTEDEVRGHNPSVLKSGVQATAFYRALWENLLRDGCWQGEITNRRKDGQLLTEWLSISSIRDAQGELSNFVGIFSDLSERKEAATRIQYLATYDPLTNLPNRNLFADRLTQALMNMRRYKRQTAVILLDLDRFRTINDTLGPPLGDEVLVEVGRRLSLQVREGDTVGRRGGNEFGFVMANVAHEHDAITLAQRMLEAISTPFEAHGTSFSLTASIGISVAPRDGDDADTLLKAADMALARAKAAGRNGFRFYSPAMDADASRRLSLEIALRDALARQELYVVYQPQASLDTGHLIGMEALLRWQHPQYGVVSPAEFIPIAEETGLILAIGQWVLETACVQTRRWLDVGMSSLRVAVNLSTRQFRQSNLVQQVDNALKRSGLPPQHLELEITESAFIDDVQGAVAQALALKELGVKLSLDDFGTGYSSLAYLSRFPFDKLKIDQGFVRDITENPVNAAIATAAIVMGRSLNLSVLAEGVETEAQARFLRSRRCDAMQGYLYSRPLLPADFEQLLAGKPQLPLPASTDDATPTLLLVDDEQNVINALSRLFRREGYRILTANSPAEAFDLLAKNTVQVIVSDQRMPDMTGTEFFSRVRQLYPATMRIVLTGYTDIDSVKDAINRGAIYKFLTKPWDDDELRDQIREAFRLARDLASPHGGAAPNV